MNSHPCVKCGDLSYSKPRYNSATNMLDWTCGSCGYGWTTPCDDAKEKSDA